MALTKVTEKVITNNLSISGIASASNFKTGTTNIHSVGVEAAGINVLGEDTPIGSGSTIYDDGGARFSGIVTATSFVGSGANLTGIDATSIKHTDGNVKIQAINTGANVTGNLSVSGNLGVAGVLTYEDVTNVDSVGIITARSGIRVGANGIKRESIHSDVGNSGANYLRFTNTTTGNGTADGFNVGIDENEDSLIWNFEDKNTILATNNLERLRIDNGGRILTSGETATEVSAGGIHIKTTNAGATTQALILENHSSNASTEVQIKFAPTTSTPNDRFNAITCVNVDGNNKFDTIFHTCPGGTPQERLRIISTGSVGIGITLPDQKLHVYEQSGSSQAYIHVQNNRSRNAAIKFTTTQGSWLFGQGIGVDADRLMVYDTEERLSIDANGDVLIGTSSWSYKKPLNVQGSSGSILALSNYDTTTYAANTNTSIELRLKTGNTGSQDGSCEIRAFKENGTNGNSARGLNFWTAGSGASPSEKFRITSYGDVYSTNSAYNTYDTAATSVNTIVEANENRPGVYWLDFNSVKFRAYVKPNWLQGRNWVLAAKYFDIQDMPSGSSLWTNDTYVNESDFNLYGGLMSKYRSWRYFSFNRLAMQMGNRIPPIMQFNSNQTLYGAFSGGYAANGGGVTADSTDPSLGTATDVTYHSMDNYAGPDFHDVVGSEDRLGSYGLNKWANASTNSTSATNFGSVGRNNAHWDEVATTGAGYNSPNGSGFNSSSGHSLDYRSLKGWRMTVEDSLNLTGVDSLGRAGAWIGCPLDEGNSTQTANGSNAGADSGFGLGGGAGNPGRSWTSGYAEWGQGNYVVNCLPAYIWLSID